jgi:hypothetical protein
LNVRVIIAAGNEYWDVSASGSASGWRVYQNNSELRQQDLSTRNCIITSTRDVTLVSSNLEESLKVRDPEVRRLIRVYSASGRLPEGASLSASASLAADLSHMHGARVALDGLKRQAPASFCPKAMDNEQLRL